MKKLCLLLTVVLVFCSLCGFVTASGKGITHNDSLLTSQLGYEKKIDNSYLQNTANENKIKVAVQTFIFVSRAKMRNGNAYDEKFLINKSKLNDANILYRLKLNELHYQLNKKLRVIKWDNIDLKDFNVTINGDQADASIVENYSYYIDDTFKDTCYENKEYYFTLSLSGGRWYITSIKTSDPWEKDANFVYKDFDVNQAVNDVLAPSSKPSNAQELLAAKDNVSNVSGTTSALYTWSYYPSTAISYAATWFNNYNSAFPESSDDCQNFVSQCIWAGLLGQSKGTKVPPVVYDPTYGSTIPTLWEHNNYYKITNPCKANGYGWFWDFVDGFAYMLVNSSPSSPGPYGNVLFGEVWSCNAGDELIYSTSTSPACGNLNHAMFITKVTGTYNNRTIQDIFIAAHNDPTTSAYEPLTQYEGYKTAEHYSDCYVEWGDYSVPQ